jgi:hypothetical protein
MPADAHTGRMMRLDRRWLAIAQGAYFAASGVWPLFSPGSFQWITGPKTDIWLVKTAGVLVSVIGTTLAVAGARNNVSTEVRLLAVGSAAGLTAIDVAYVRAGRISRIYLLDAAAEVALIAAWAVAPEAEMESTAPK